MFDQQRQQVLAELRRKISAEPVTAAPSTTISSTTTAAPSTAAALFTTSAVAATATTALSVTTTAATLRSAGRPVLAVPGPLAEILPGGGLPRGGVVSLGGGAGATSLLFSLLAAPANTWSALVGMPDVGLLAASELGVDLDRVVLIPYPGPDALQVLSVLADGVDIIVAAPPRGGAGWSVAPARQRVLTARLRQSGAVLLVAGAWPGADLVLDCRIERWTGLGRGHGRLKDRELIVEVGGRRAAGRRASAAMFLTSRRSSVDIDVGAAPERFVLDPAISEVV
ncbi:hypothetical protein ABIB25_002037 [Nakamurella sp. UYEF19]|uniref:hypothetical protein n=1 Tax=Nakamurella sp. UYEF19 TaxID=1756392 RepID=UPI003392CC15